VASFLLTAILVYSPNFRVFNIFFIIAGAAVMVIFGRLLDKNIAFYINIGLAAIDVIIFIASGFNNVRTWFETVNPFISIWSYGEDVAMLSINIGIVQL
jgi:hypothetical protein